VAEFHQFQDLCEQVVVVSEQLCAARPVEDALSRQEVEREVSGLLRIVFQDLRRTDRLDLEAVEMAMRAAIHQAGLPH